jgi:hypothetical protein
MSDTATGRGCVRPSLDGREVQKTRAAVIAWRASLRVAAIPEISDRLSGAAIDEVKKVIEAELDNAFRWGGPPPEEE